MCSQSTDCFTHLVLKFGAIESFEVVKITFDYHAEQLEATPPPGAIAILTLQFSSPKLGEMSLQFKEECLKPDEPF